MEMFLIFDLGPGACLPYCNSFWNIYYWFRPNAGQCPSDQAARSDAAAGWLACDEATMGDAELLTESPSIAGHFFSRRLRFLGPQDGSPDRARPVSLRIGWRRSVLAIVL